MHVHTRRGNFCCFFFAFAGSCCFCWDFSDLASLVRPPRLQPLTQQERQRWRHSSPGLRRSESISRMFESAAHGSNKGTRQR